MSVKKRTGDRLLTHCPGGHELPRRVKWLARCTADECGGPANARPVSAAQLQSVEETKGFAEETEQLLDARGRMAAWDAQHPLPKVTQAPEFKRGSSIFQYLRDRTAQAAPLALERIIRKALLVPGPAGDAAADNILDRMGFTRKGEAPVEFNGPVSIINLDPSRIPLLSQKSAEKVIQGQLVSTTQGAGDGDSVSGEAKERVYVAGGSGDDGARAGAGVRADDSPEDGGRVRPEIPAAGAGDGEEGEPH